MESIVLINALTTLKTLGASTILICVGVGCLVIFRPLIQEKRQLEFKRDSYRQDNDRMTSEIARLKKDQNLFAIDPDFVEQIARKANRVRPNEIVFVFPPDE